MFARKREGATLGLIPVVILILALIGITFYYLALFFGGNKQLINGTDSSALGTARQLLAVGLTAAEIGNLPIEFQSLGVDQNGKPTGLNPDGTPNLNNAIFNVYAFNRAAGLTLLVALNAAEDGSGPAVANANNLIAGLNNFGNELNNDLANAPQLAATFDNLAASNTINMLGSQSSISLANNGNLQFAKVPGEGGGQANIYFNNAIYTNDPNLTNWIQRMTSNAGTASQVNNRYNQGDPSAQPGQPLVVGYQPIDMTAITGIPGFASQIFACSVNPSQMPHMIDPGRFNNAGIANNYAPSNSISAQAQATSTHRGGTDLLCTALACAMLGSYDNEYPISMPYGWIRIQNGKDAIAANPALSPVPLYAGNGDTIYNRQLWSGPGGNYGIWSSNNGVFCTEAFSDPSDPFDTGPVVGYSGGAEINAWLTYNTTPCTGTCVPDLNGHNPIFNPNIIQPSTNTYLLGYQSPTANMRYSATFNQTASLPNMLGITAVNPVCNSFMYGDDTPSYCSANVATWASNYIPANYWVPPDDNGTQPVGGLTNLEYVKGAVIGGLDGLWDEIAGNGGGGEGNPLFAPFTYTVNLGQNASGSKEYDHSGSTNYSTPVFTPGVAFGTVTTPLGLIQQLGTNQPAAAATNCADTSVGSNQWTDVSTPLGKLLQRCQMIVPSTTPTDVDNLLNTFKIDLNQYQYIYLPAGATKLVISNSPPAFLKQFPEYNNPGATLPDGTTSVLSCQDAVWSATGNGKTPLDVIGSLVNSTQTIVGIPNGDDTTNGEPFTDWAGSLSTWDGMTWTSNSGRFFFLGQMNFGNYVAGNGTASTTTGPTFSQPN